MKTREEQGKPQKQQNKQGKSQERTKNKTRRAVTAREVALDVLIRVEQDQSYSNLLLNQSLQKAALSRQDAALATELVYGTIQRLSTMDYFLERFVRQGLAKLQPWVRSLLRLSFYQLYYLDRIPAHAVVNEAVNIARARGHQGISGMVNAVLRNVLRNKAQLVIPANLPTVQRISLLHSHPQWIVARWLEQYGEAITEQICKANNRPPTTSVRVNTTRQTRDQLLTLLEQQGIEARRSGLSPAGIIIEEGGNMAHSAMYRDGLISIQDESSMLVAEFVAPEPNMHVLDCCAAPGGKTTHIAEKMQDTGDVLAVDLHEHKVKLIAEQSARLGLNRIRYRAADVLQLASELSPASFDRILLDAPCSGLGVIRRKPDLKWSKQEQDVVDISQLQLDLLHAVQGLLKPGGILVYSTCTILSAENEQVVESFLQKYPSYEVVRSPLEYLPELVNEALVARGMVQILPHQFDSDGFFIARMRKKENL